MEVLYILFPAALVLAAIAVGAYVWAARNGQFDDVETPPLRMLHDDQQVDASDEPTPRPPRSAE